VPSVPELLKSTQDMSTQRHMQSHSFSFYFIARKNPAGATTGFNSFPLRVMQNPKGLYH